MKKHAVSLVLMLGLLVGAGCVKNITLVSVNPDGSGTITVSDSFSPQLTSMMSGMGGAMEGMVESMGAAMSEMTVGAEGAEASPFTVPALNFDESMKEAAANRTKDFGPGVELVGTEPTTGKDGWKGYKATYKFPDINQVRVAVGGADLTPDGTSESDDDEQPSFTFKFVAGTPARLEVVPDPSKKARSEPAADVGVDSPGDDMGAAAAMGAGMSQMMMPMLGGLRLSLLVKVNGEVVETNSDYQSEAHPNVITVMDLNVGKMVANAQAMSILASGNDDPEGFAKLRALNIPGVKLEDESKTISVLFQ